MDSVKYERGIVSIAFSPDGNILALADYNRTIIELWDIQKKILIHSLEGHKETVTSVAFSPDGHILASRAEDRTIKLWDLQNKKLIYSFEFELDNFGIGFKGYSIVFSPDGNTLVSTSRDNTIKFLDIKNKKNIHSFEQHKTSIWSVTFSPDGKTLASASFAGTIKLWDLHNKKLLYTFGKHKSWVKFVALSPNGNILASVSIDGTVKLWNLQNKKLIYSFEGEKGNSMFSVAFSSDSKTLAFTYDDGFIKLLDLRNKKDIFSLKAVKADGTIVSSIAFNPDNTILASASFDRTVKLWNLQNKKLIHTFMGHKDRVKSVVFSPDGNTLASASLDKTVKLWDTHSKKLIHSFDGHKQAVNAVAFSPDGNTLASASSDQTVKLWDTHSKKLLHSFDGHKNPVLSVAFSPDGNTLASAFSDGTVKLWNTHSKKLKHDLIGGTQGTWLWQDYQTGKFWRGDNGTLLLQPDKGYIPLPPPQVAKKDDLTITPVQKQLTLNSGVLSELKITVTNNSNTPVWWIETRQTTSKRLVVYPTHHNRLDGKQSTTLTLKIGAYVATEPKPFTDTLRFEFVTAAGSRFPVSIPVTVHTPQLQWQNAQLLDDQRTLKLTLFNNGEQAIPQASFRLSNLSEQLKIETNLLAKTARDITFSLPEGTKLAKDSQLTLSGWTPSLPLFKWEFANKAVTLPRPTWQLYAALVLLVLLVTLSVFYLRRYKHPLLSQLSAQPTALLQLLPEQLHEAQRRLKQTHRLQKVLADAEVSEQRLQGAIAFIAGEHKADNNTASDAPHSASFIRATWLAQRLGGTLTVLDKDLFSLKLNAHFPLNVEHCLLFFPTKTMAAIDALNHLKSLSHAAQRITLVIGHHSDYQRELRRKTLDVGNKWVAPSGTALTELLLSTKPDTVLAQIIAEQILLTQISPYQLGGGTSRESIFFGRGEMIAHIMNRDPANYLLVAGRQLGKSTLLKALHRRYQDHAQIRCFYRVLADEKLAPQLARALRLSSKSSLESIVEYLEQQAEKEQCHYLFLLDEADTFIRHERDNNYNVLNRLRQLSEAGHCSFILAGFWHLYDYSVLDYQSPLKNFGEVLQLGALENEACQQLASVPMQNMGIRYASTALVDDLIAQTGQRANLISISCNELLKQLDKTERVIEAGALHRALNSDPITRAMEGWKNLSGITKDDRIDRIIVYAMIPQAHFTLSELDAVLKQNGFTVKIAGLERSLARLELAFILQRKGKQYDWRVPLFCQRLREQELDIRLRGELDE